MADVIWCTPGPASRACSNRKVRPSQVSAAPSTEIRNMAQRSKSKNSATRAVECSTCWSPAPAMSAWRARWRSARRDPTWRSRSSTPRPRASGRRTAALRRWPPPPRACWSGWACGTRSRRQAQAMTEMIVTDSRTADPVRPVFLTFDGEVAPGEPFAHMVANKVLNGALRRRAAELGIDIVQGVAVEGFDTDAGRVTVRLADGSEVRGAPAGRRRRRPLAAARDGRHRHGRVGIRPVRHRLHGGARAPAQRPRRGAFPARRSLRHPAAEARRGRVEPLLDRLDRTHRGGRAAGRARIRWCSKPSWSAASG